MSPVSYPGKDTSRISPVAHLTVDPPTYTTPRDGILTGDGEPDVMYGYALPRFMLNGVLSSHAGAWRQVPFDGESEAYQLDASSGALVSTYIGQFPDGAGAFVKTYRYDPSSGGFVGS